MTHAHFLSISKKASTNIVGVAASHNLRKLGLAHGPHIDLRRSELNRVLRGPDDAEGVVSLSRKLMLDAGVDKLRKDAVRMVEVLFSLPDSSSIDPHAYFEQAVLWAETYFNVPILSAVIHLDEGAPHCHVLLLPLVDGCMLGSDLVGGPSKFRAMQTAFHDAVGSQHGLTRKAPQRRHSAACRRQTADSVLDALQANPARLNDPEVRAALVALIGADPERLAQALNVDMPVPMRKPKAKPATSFVKQMTRAVKPDRPERAKPNRVRQEETLLGFASSATPAEKQTLSCVGFQLSAASIPADSQSSAQDAKQVQRVRDDDAGPGYWSEQLGEWVPLPAKQSRKLTAILAPRH